MQICISIGRERCEDQQCATADSRSEIERYHHSDGKEDSLEPYPKATRIMRIIM